MTIIAKPVIDKQFWILQENNQKVGNVQACIGGYQVQINNQTAQFKTIKMIRRQVDIEFEPSVKIPVIKTVYEVHGFPTVSRPYNSMWDIKHKLPIYTKTKKSKSWFVAGWYRIKTGRHWQIMQDPKLIVVQRYPYAGPFHNEQQANEHTSASIC
jgi:hypothetical protein